MTPTRQARLVERLLGDRKSTRGDAPWAERLLLGLGASSAFAEAVLGDLAEERAIRERENGAIAARWWYAREAVRSAPHLLVNAVRHGGVRGRARVAAVLVGAAIVPAAVLIALQLRDGPPARLVVGGQHGADISDGIVLNTRRPVQLAVRAFDAKGHALPPADVRYRWASGMSLKVTPSGVVTCKRAGDAVVRASAGTLDTTVLLRCRPVKVVRANWEMNLLAGGPGQDLRFEALDPDHRPVTLLAGELRVQDSTIATLNGAHVRPVAPGQTAVIVHIGDGEGWIGVSVFEQVRSLAGLRPDQRLVVVPVRLAPGDTIRWPLPKGHFWVRFSSMSSGQPMPSATTDGPIMCMPAVELSVEDANCLARGPGASLRLAHPGTAKRAIAGSLSLTRWPDEENEPPPRPCQNIDSSKC